MIYAVQCGAGGPIKIGKAGDVHKRLSQLQVSSPVKLTLLTSQETLNDSETERQIHEVLAAHRIRGEWFRPTVPVLEIVRNMRERVAEHVMTQREALKIVTDYRAHVRKQKLLQLLVSIHQLAHAKPVHQGRRRR